jgi:hypothetical protein
LIPEPYRQGCGSTGEFDHTRYFRLFANIFEAEKIKYCESGLWKKLKQAQALSKDFVATLLRREAEGFPGVRVPWYRLSTQRILA